MYEDMIRRVQAPGLSLTFTADEIENARKRGSLLSLDVELTKQCNLRCIYCYANAGERQMNELKIDEVLHIIDEAKELGIRTLNLTGGEPLIHENYFEIATYAYKRGICVLLFTNGTLVTRKVARKLMDLRVSPCVKLDSLSPTIQDYLAGTVGAFGRIMRGIKNLIEVGYTTEYPVLSVNAVICRQNMADLPKWWNWVRKQNITPTLTRLQLMGRALGRSDLAVTPHELYKLYSKLSEIDRRFGINWEPKIPWIYGRACRRHYIGCFIDSTGNVQPCSGVPIKVGNIRKQHLKEILSSSELFKISRNIEKFLEGACGKCEFKNECYGCRSIAYFATGRFTAADTLCWRNIA